MSATNSALFIHRIAIQMSPEGRFLICLDCQLHLEFPVGTPYLAVAREFGSHRCDSHTENVGLPRNVS